MRIIGHPKTWGDLLKVLETVTADQLKELIEVQTQLNESDYVVNITYWPRILHEAENGHLYLI